MVLCLNDCTCSINAIHTLFSLYHAICTICVYINYAHGLACKIKQAVISRISQPHRKVSSQPPRLPITELSFQFPSFVLKTI